jgi:hypothetical protein
VTEKDLFQVTRTNTRRYIGICNLDGCDYRTDVVSLRVRAALLVRDHCRRVHGSYAADLFLKRESVVKQPNQKLPEPEKLADYKDHLVVFADAKPGAVKSIHGTSEVDCLAYVYLKGHWKSLGETPIWWKSVGFQILDADGEPIGGILTQGTDRNDREWCLVTVKSADKENVAALKSWDKEYAESF